MGYSLKVFDGYRPQMAVEDFWEWANDPTDIENQRVYYPDFKNKVDLFNGYIARRSAHSRGSAVDLTIIDLAQGKELDMGERFDFLGERSNTAFEGISETAKDNRLLLKTIMEKHGFENYWREWWHYSLKGEPFNRTPEDHFNFPVE
jgi:D-alanyl-D-alanine dipeptidase